MATTAEIFAQYGIPSNIWQPIMQVESGGNPAARALTSREDSVGLFQLNRKGGLGTGYTVEELSNPEFNASLAAHKMSPLYQRGIDAGLTGYDLTQYVAFNGGWPTQAGVKALAYDKTVQNYDARLRQVYEGYSSYSLKPAVSAVDYKSSAPAPGVIGQLSTLQKTAESGGTEGIGLMLVLAVLGIVLIFLGIKIMAGGETIAVALPGGED